MLNLVMNPAMKRRKSEERGRNILVEKSNQMPGVSNLKNQIHTWVISPLKRVANSKVIDETALEPPEPDYAHLPARPFETKKQLSNAAQSSAGTVGVKN